MLEFLALAAVLQMDPSGDAHGAGELVPPTAAIFSSSAPFDLTEVTLLDRDVLTLRVRLADRSNPGELPNGITLPVIDVYLDTEPGGADELLPGPGLRMPEGRGWEIAVRVTGDRAFATRSGDAASVEHSVTVTTEGDALLLATPFAAPEHATLHAMTGAYDPFGPDAWRPLAREPSPWSFSSETSAFPVVDLLAEDDAAQRAALESGVLPAGRARNPAAPWLVLMVAGLAIASGGLLLRSRVGRGIAGSTAEEGQAVATDAVPGDAVPAHEAPSGTTPSGTTPSGESAVGEDRGEAGSAPASPDAAGVVAAEEGPADEEEPTSELPRPAWPSGPGWGVRATDVAVAPAGTAWSFRGSDVRPLASAGAGTPLAVDGITAEDLPDLTDGDLFDAVSAADGDGEEKAAAAPEEDRVPEVPPASERRFVGADADADS